MLFVHAHASRCLCLRWTARPSRRNSRSVKAAEKVAAVGIASGRQGDARRGRRCCKALARRRIADTPTASACCIVNGDRAHRRGRRAKKSARCRTGLEDITVNNRLRGELATALAALKLVSADRSTRLAAAKELGERRRRSDAAAHQESTGQRKGSRNQGRCWNQSGPRSS